MTHVQKLWPGSTVVCIASGPSLTQSDVDAVRGRARVIAINDTYTMAPWADLHYGCDDHWWQREYKSHRSRLLSFSGLRFCMEPGRHRVAAPPPELGVQVMRDTGIEGLELDRTGLKNGRNSGYQAIGMSVHLGAARILLLGYDMSLGRGGKTHWFGKDWQWNDRQSKLTKFRLHFPTIAPPLKALGIEVLNCSRRSALTCFPKVPLEQALLKVAA